MNVEPTGVNYESQREAMVAAAREPNGCATNAMPEPPSPLNDERFARILENARKLTGLARELSEISHCKLDELLGSTPIAGPASESEKPDCWADSVLLEQDRAGVILRDAIDRIHSV